MLETNSQSNGCKNLIPEPVGSKRVLEVGCGAGGNLLQLMELGFLPENLVGNELLSDRATMARQRLPAAIKILVGDAAEVGLGEGPFDIVYQSTVFTSILDDGFQQKLPISTQSKNR